MNWPLSFRSHWIWTVRTSFTCPWLSPVNFFDGGEINARVGAEFRRRFLLAVVELVNLRPFGPGIVLGAIQRRLRQNFNLHQALAALAQRRAHAVRAGVAAADDDDVPAFGGDVIPVLVPIQQGAGVGRQKIHREMNALEVPAFDGQIARLGRAGRKNHRVKFLEQFLSGIIFSGTGILPVSCCRFFVGRAGRPCHFGVADKLDALGFHLLDAAQHGFLLVELHVRDAVHEQSAGPVVAFKHRDVVAGPVQLRRRAQARRAGTDHGHFFASPLLRRFGQRSSLRPSLFRRWCTRCF